MLCDERGVTKELNRFCSPIKRAAGLELPQRVIPAADRISWVQKKTWAHSP